MTVYETALLIVGFLLGLLLFFKRPALCHKNSGDKDRQSLTVIIPARNEERNLPCILGDLLQQTRKADEIICVDDGSSDRTADIARSFGVTVVTVSDKPDDWTGKSFACQTGADRARGEFLLFLDADVRLTPGALEKLVATRSKNACAVSVQPHHLVEKPYEQMSLFFNLLMIAANGVCLPFRRQHIGLFGPVVLIGRSEYDRIGGHASVRQSIADDLALGERLKAEGLPFKLFLGGKDISFRMYGENFRQLLQGWTKNFATGALKTPLALLAAVFWWVTAVTAAPLNIVLAAAGGRLAEIYLFAGVYLAFAIEVAFAARAAGNFSKFSVLLYPFSLSVFFFVFIRSLYKKIFHRSVKWKGRNVALRK